MYIENPYNKLSTVVRNHNFCGSGTTTKNGFAIRDGHNNKRLRDKCQVDDKKRLEICLKTLSGRHLIPQNYKDRQ